MEGTAMISRAIIDEIIFRNDIEQVIGSYVTLKRAGSNLNGLCPFHNEKTPSFTVFPATKSFYCFGCGAGGDVITFIMKTENLDYREALELLASRAGIAIPEDDSQSERLISRKRIYEMNMEAARFFRSCLFDERYGKEALAYLHEERKLSIATIKHFGLGFSPNNAWLLTNHMKSLGFTDEELVTGFLCGKSKTSGRTYDYFRNRVIFPIIDTSGNVVAFGGRVMDDSKPKYLNTSDTPAFKKSRHLFALNFAKKHCEEQMMLCEGYMDVIAMHASGFENAVATLGTAITSEQARIFAKHTKKVIICYDADNAGQTAAAKAMRLLGEVGVEVRVLKIPGAKDPDEYIKKFGVDNFKKVLGESKTGFDHNLDKIIAAHNIELPEDKIKASSEVTGLIAGVYSQVERDIYVRKAAERLGVSADALRGDVERASRRLSYERKQKQSAEAQMAAKNIGDRINVDAAKYIKANACEEALLGLMLIYDEFRRDAASGSAGVSAEDFVTEFGRRVFEALCELENSEEGYSKAMLGQHFGIDEIGRIEKIEVDRMFLNKNDREVFENCIANLKEEKRRLVQSRDDPFADLRAKQAALRDKKKKEN